ncbi:unnamed protein product [Blepharisma stoltei]|uniref:Alanyl-tRNA synthetase n=1 Tax=Blepharisma stoltei TaxID=1481888 RepID=A0AAU9JVS8_9CILI|nr:unnamed protein product [Blepharisma stoltei]
MLKIIFRMESTLVREFLQDSYKFACNSRILSSIQAPEGSWKIKLDRTVFHPQGGGQPSDSGFITQGEIKFQVATLENDKEDENIWHVGKYLGETVFDNSGEVIAEIDENQRRLFARLHSAGHLIDLAVHSLGYNLPPGKGFHFPRGAYVEYLALLPNEERDTAAPRINEVLEKLIAETEEGTSVRLYDYEEAKANFDIPSFFQPGKPIRIVKLCNADAGGPCGGTHVKHIREIGRAIVTKLQKKGKNLRVSYELADN